MITFYEFLEAMSRRSFLGTVTGTVLGAKKALGADFKNFENMPVDTNMKGKDQKSTDQLVHLLYPRNEDEERKLKNFTSYVYGFSDTYNESLRPMIQKYLTMPKERQEDEYFRFLLKYTSGKLPVAVKQTNKGSNVSSTDKGVPHNINYDHAQATKHALPSRIMRHEIDHVYQGDLRMKNVLGNIEKDGIENNPERQILESLAALYDIGSMVVIDQRIRKNSNLSLKYDKQNQPLYKLNISFPSGQNLELSTLAVWAKQGGIAALKNPQTAMQIFAKYARYIESLIYGKRTKPIDRTYQNQSKPSKESLYAKYKEMYYQELKNMLKDYPKEYPDGGEKKAKEVANKMSYIDLIKILKIDDDPYYYVIGNNTIIPR